MGGLFWPDEMGDWEWDGEPLIWPGGHPETIEQLWSGPSIDGEDKQMPEVHGALSRRWSIVEAVHEVSFLLSGLWLPDGTPASNVGVGIDANYTYLCGVIGSPLTWSGPDVETTVETSSGRTLTGRAKGFVSPLGPREGSVNRVSVTVVIPAGFLAETGS